MGEESHRPPPIGEVTQVTEVVETPLALETGKDGSDEQKQVNAVVPVQRDLQCK